MQNNLCRTRAPLRIRADTRSNEFRVVGEIADKRVREAAFAKVAEDFDSLVRCLKGVEHLEEDDAEAEHVDG